MKMFLEVIGAFVIIRIFLFAENTTYYVSSFKGKDFRISTQPSEHSLYAEEFRFTLEHPRGNPKEKPYYIYSAGSSGQSFVTRKLVLFDHTNFPLDIVVLNNVSVGLNSRRIYLIDRSNYGPMITLDGHGNVTCCKAIRSLSFYAYHVIESGKKPKKV